eukprot:TRINITY_DN3209_c0_g1_i2.p1 TRINITY_DN3209_c0_g1~~TRINITY_DN3209_c0_g1_i2.p1  ORF type:complete len:146 (-),score=35.64 TRINITY_DN3209_c0_g1_i2:6-443(-)
MPPMFVSFFTLGISVAAHDRSSFLLCPSPLHSLLSHPKGTFGELLPVVCPELQESQTQIEANLLSLIDKVISGRENLGVTFSHEFMQGISSKSVADKSFKVMRSCILLSFCWAVIQVWQTYNEQGAEEEEEEGEKQNEDGDREQQ